MNEFLSKTGLIFFAFLFMTGASLAQQTAHQHDQGRATSIQDDPKAEGAALRASPQEILKSSDDSLRAIEKAVRQKDGRALSSSMKEYRKSMEMVESYFDKLSSDSEDFAGKVSQAEKSLDRQIMLLNRLGSQTPSEFRADLKTVLESAQRVRDGLTAADFGASPQGHQGKESHFGRKCRD